MITTTIINNAPKLPFCQISRDRLDVSVRGLRINIEDVKKGILKGIAALQESFLKLCCGKTFPELDAAIDAIHDRKNSSELIDDLHQNVVGYSPFTDPKNPLHKFRLKLYEALMDRANNTISGKAKLYTESNTGEILFSDNEIRVFFENLDEFVQVSTVSKRGECSDAFNQIAPLPHDIRYVWRPLSGNRTGNHHVYST